MLNNKNTDDEELKSDKSQVEKIPDDFVAVKASGVKQQTNLEQINEKLAEQIDTETDLAKTDEVFEDNTEILSETSETEQVPLLEEVNDETFEEEGNERPSVADSFEVGFVFKY